MGALLLSLFSGCGGLFISVLHGSGVEGTEVRKLSGATQVILEGAGDVVLKQGDQESITITTDQNLLSYVDTEVEGTVLRLGFRRGMSYQSSLGIRMEVTLKDLRNVSLTGTGNIRGTGLQLESLLVRLEGTGDVALGGTADSMEVRLSGTGSVRALGMSAARVDVDLAGVGNAEVWARESLVARLSGVGNILYGGQPGEVHAQVSGLGSITAK